MYSLRTACITSLCEIILADFNLAVSTQTTKLPNLILARWRVALFPGSHGWAEKKSLARWGEELACSWTVIVHGHPSPSTSDCPQPSYSHYVVIKTTLYSLYYLLFNLEPPFSFSDTQIHWSLQSVVEWSSCCWLQATWEHAKWTG